MKRRNLALLAAAALALGIVLADGGAPWPTQNIPKEAPDAPKAYPPGELGKMVKLGEDIFNNTDTHPLSKQYVGNKLQCKSCHSNSGKDKTRYSTFIGTASSFPAYSPREKTVLTLEGRSLNCFMRSMNGIRPPVGSKVSVALATYITWISTGMPVDMNPNKPVGPYNYPWPDPEVISVVKSGKVDMANGEKIYNTQCAACHGTDGNGIGPFPPVWGDNSYNSGAGMSNVIKGGSWVRYNMPPGYAHLSAQQAADVMAYVNSHPRPSFKLTEHLPPAEKMGEYNTNVPEQIIPAPTWPPKKK